MSIYKPKNSSYFHFDFIIQGRRFHGSTGQASRRAAEQVERHKRLEAASGQLGAVATMSLDEAAGRWWQEVGIARGDRVDVERRITKLIALIGKETLLKAIDQATVAKAVEKRKRQTFSKSAKPGAKARPVSPATVNRDVIETLRPILLRARTHWSPSGAGHGLPEIDWRTLRLREPRAVSRIYADDERIAWLEACDPDLRLALELLLTYGLRFGELFFPLDALKLGSHEPTLTLQKGRKRDVILHLPLRQDHARGLAALAAQAKEANLEHLWCFEAANGRQAFTPGMVEYRLTKAANEAGVSGGRRIHGARHHAGSTILKKTQNLKAVARLLGHASIHSSQRYVYVLDGDLRAALEDEDPRNSPEAKPRRAKTSR